MLWLIPFSLLAAGFAFLKLTERPVRCIYVLPFLLAFEYRVRISGFSFDLVELSLAIVLVVGFSQWWGGKSREPSTEVRAQGKYVFLLAVCAFPGIFFEYNLQHAASAYRDLILPFLFFLMFASLRLAREQIYALVKLACLLAVANALLGVVQYFTGNYLWLAGPDEAEWQVYKTGFAKLSIIGDFLGLQDTLPVGLYTGANILGFSLTIPLCLATVLTFSRELRKSQRLACFLAAATMFVCLAFTIFRSGLLVYVISMTIAYVLLSPRRGALRSIIVIALLGLIANTFLAQGLFDWDQFGTFEGRQEMNAHAFALMKSHPELLLTGGFTDLYFLQSREVQDIHNVALYSIVQFGLPATLVLFLFFIRALWRSLRGAFAVTGVRRTIVVALSVSVGANLFLYGATTTLVDSVQTTTWLLFWTGLALHLSVTRREGLVSQQQESVREQQPAGAPWAVVRIR